jgi:hypothetical protein
MDKKIVIAASMVIILSIAVAYVIVSGIFTAGNPRTKLVVIPETNAAVVGQDFAVDIRVLNVTDLFGWEIKLSWNVTLLDAVNVTEGSFLKNSGSTYFTYKVNNTVGYVVVDGTLLGDVDGVDGSGTLGTIKFHVKAAGECDLDLYDTSLIDSSEKKISHIAVDSEFSAGS